MSGAVLVAGAATAVFCLSMLIAVTVDILYGPNRNPPAWVDRWFTVSVVAGLWAGVIWIAARALLGAPK